MASVLRGILGSSSSKTADHDDDYNVDYSFAIEYSVPPVNHDIPQVVLIDVRQIPTAYVATRGVILDNLTLPVIQPIVKSDHSNKKLPKKSNSGQFASSSGLYSRQPENGSHTENDLGKVDEGVSKSNKLDGGKSSSSSGTLGFSDGRYDSDDVDDLDDDHTVDIDSKNSIFGSKELSPEVESHVVEASEGIEHVENHVGEISGQGNRVSAVTFLDVPSSDATSESSNDENEPESFPERPQAFQNDGKKGLCNRCQKINRFSDKEFCIVCGAKYCSKCVMRAMGSMPEGRKCITCIGYRIDEANRESLGKCSRMLKRMLTHEPVKQIMCNEISCEVNQLPPHLICVNDRPLSIDELVILQSCRNPPKKLRPGKYWYDKVSGFWGKEGEKPSQIISALLVLGYQIREDASNGDTGVFINSREITKPEILMLKAAGVHCEGNPHFWVNADGSYTHEGMNYMMGKLCEKTRVQIVCAALSLPFPFDTSNYGGEDVDKETDKSSSKNFEQKMLNKLLLLCCDQSRTSTIFKQAKILYDDDKQTIKCMIQRNLYRYICILLEGHAHFEEEYFIELKGQSADQSDTSEESENVEEKNIYSLSRNLKAFSHWLLQIMISGNLDAIIPAATREYSPRVEELWKDKAFQLTYKRRNELPMLPRVANYFLDRAVEISRMDYEPSQMDMLYAKRITSSNGVVCNEADFRAKGKERKNLRSYLMFNL